MELLRKLESFFPQMLTLFFRILTESLEVIGLRHKPWCGSQFLEIPQYELKRSTEIDRHLNLKRYRHSRDCRKASFDSYFITLTVKNIELLLVAWQSKEISQEMWNLMKGLLPAFPEVEEFVDLLPDIMDVFEDKAFGEKFQGYGPSHIAACFGWTQLFQFMDVNTPDAVNRKTPLMVAIEHDRLDVVRELISRGADVKLTDADGRNVLHYAVEFAHDENILKELLACEGSAELLTKLDHQGESVLHEACSASKDSYVKMLLEKDADLRLLTASPMYPVHVAAELNEVNCLNFLCGEFPEQLTLKDKQFGATPLHWVETKEAVEKLCDIWCSHTKCGLHGPERYEDIESAPPCTIGEYLETLNNDGETALLVKAKQDEQEYLKLKDLVQKDECTGKVVSVREKLYRSIFALLVRGAKVDVQDKEGLDAIHYAISADNLNLVKLLIVFGAQANIHGISGNAPQELLPNTKNNRDDILGCLHMAGAIRCDAPDECTCTKECTKSGTSDGVPPEIDPKTEIIPQVDDVSVNNLNEITPNERVSVGDRVLCLDGGGIRGLVLVQMLLEIEKLAGIPIKDCFDWIGGTSTGGFLALSLVHGKTLHFCRSLYFQLKNQVFTGNRPYSQEPLEDLLKRVFGATTTMAQVEKPKVILTTVLADRLPSELRLFTNYDAAKSNPAEATSPQSQLVWEAGRSSGAAPSYFPAHGSFIDGGIMSNNPTTEVLSAIQQYNTSLPENQVSWESSRRPVRIVLSLGTGHPPTTKNDGVNIHRLEGFQNIIQTIGDNVSGAVNFVRILVDQVTQTDGLPVTRSKAWCSMIGAEFHRFSPQLSKVVDLDCKDDDTLIDMLWQTQCYINSNRQMLQHLRDALKPPSLDRTPVTRKPEERPLSPITGSPVDLYDLLRLHSK